MRVLTIGATGYLGGAAARGLRTAGHTVVAAARSAGSRAALEALGYEVVNGDVNDPAGLAGVAAGCDAVVYAVQLSGEDAERIETAALQALAGALDGSGKALIYTSGVWYYGATGERVAIEATPANPLPTGAARPRLEAIVSALAARGGRPVILRPGCVYGEGKGLPAIYVEQARSGGPVRTIGDGDNRWAVVHVADLAAIYALALDKAKPGDVFNATARSEPAQREIARAASLGSGRDGRVGRWPLEEAKAALGAWAAALALDQRVSSERAARELGWMPSGPSLLDDLQHGSYATHFA